MRNMLVVLAFVSLFWMGGSAPSEGAQEPKEGRLTRLSERVYVDLVEAGGEAVSNSGIVILDESVLVFDTHFTPEAGLELLEAISAVTRKPVRYIINSHFHPDHTHGNQVYSAPVDLIGTTRTRHAILEQDLPSMERTVAIAQKQIESLRKRLTAARDPLQQRSLRRQLDQRRNFVDRMSGLQIVAPTLTVDDRLTLTEGNCQIELHFMGRGHTDGDLILYLPEDKIVFAGDLFFNRALPNPQDASLLEWGNTLDKLLEMNADTFLPGHGPLGNREDVEKFRSFLNDLESIVTPYVTGGSTLEEVLRSARLPFRYVSFSFQNFFQLNLQKMYQELKSIQLRVPDGSNKPGQPLNKRTPGVGQ